MSQYLIFLIYIMIRVNRGASQEESVRGREMSSNNSVCGEEGGLLSIPCPYFENVDGVDCLTNRAGLDSEYNISVVCFHKYKHVPAGMLKGYSIKKIIVTDPDTTVAENFLEGVLDLQEFRVEESSIEVMLFI